MQVVVDIWGDVNDTTHLARFIVEWNNQAQQLVSKELQDGFLVNIRREIKWGADQNFDLRKPGEKGLN